MRGINHGAHKLAYTAIMPHNTVYTNFVYPKEQFC